MLDGLNRRGKALFALGLILVALGAGVGFLHPDAQQTSYEYQVKSEQIETDAGYNGTAVPIEELPSEQRAAIFEAYKKSGHFLGGSSAYIETDEPLNIQEDDRWRAVEIEGVRVLVGISGPDTIERLTFLGGVSAAVMMIGAVKCVALFVGTAPRNRRR